MYKSEQLFMQRQSDLNSEISESMKEIRKRHKRKIDTITRKIQKEGCNHHYYKKHKEQRDDGYCKRWTVTVKTCKVCGKKNERDSDTWPLKETV